MYKSILRNSEEITDFIIKFAGESIDEDLVEEYFYKSYAILKCVSVNSLKFEHESNHIRNKFKEKEYKLLLLETLPPLIVENNIVIDGNHRLRILKKMGIKEVFVYDIISM